VSADAGICRVRAVKDYERPHAPAGAAWWVSCRVCPTPPGGGGFAGDVLEKLLDGRSQTRLGWSPRWDWAMSFAVAHAQLHADRACVTCRHVPETPVSLEDTQALLRARA
jgi:hypothetical protein